MKTKLQLHNLRKKLMANLPKSKQEIALKKLKEAKKKVGSLYQHEFEKIVSTVRFS